MQQERDKLCYLTIGDKDEKWGVVVTTIGYQFIPPGTKYPLSAHPDKYSFMPRGGRILNEYQLVYITKGSGYSGSRVPISTTGWQTGFSCASSRYIISG